MIDWQRLIPCYWFQNEKTDWGWDKALNEALDRYTPVKKYLSYQIGPFDVWASNWPYAYGNRYDKASGLPSVSTRKRLRRLVSCADTSIHRKDLEQYNGQ